MKEMVGGCCVCSDERGWPENPLVYCDGQNCTVAVHQACYGIVTVPTGPWYCRKCESQERSARVRCELCPSRDGALKKTDNQGWAHVVCALYIPEVRFGNVTTMEPIILQLIPPERYSKTCYICQDNSKGSRANAGACMQCNKSGCKQQFHVTCAQGLGLLCEEAGNYLDNVKYCGYCQHHYSKLKKGGNVKTIPPYKPVTHDTDTSSGSSPEKEVETTTTVTASTTSATTIKITTNQNITAGQSATTSSSSSKQRKSSFLSKLPSIASNPSGSGGGNTLASSGIGGSNSGVQSISGNSTSGTGINSNSSLISNKSSSGSSSSKDKEKHSSSSKGLSKISSSTKDKDKESSSSSSSSREKSSKSSKNSNKIDTSTNSDHGGVSSISGGGGSSNSIISSTNSSAISNTTSVIPNSSNLTANSLHGKDNIAQKFTTSNFTETVVMNSESVFGSGTNESAGSINTSGSSTKSSSSSTAKKRKADSAKMSSSVNDSVDINSSFRDIIKDVSVTLIPLPMDKTDVADTEKGSKKPKTETINTTSTTPHQTSNTTTLNHEPNLQNVSPNLLTGTTTISINKSQIPSNSSTSSSSSQQLTTSNSTGNNIGLNTNTGVSSNSTPIVASVTGGGGGHHLKNSIIKDDNRLRSNSPYHTSTSSSNSISGATGTTPSLYVSVPLSTANVPGINLPTTTTSNVDHVGQTQSNRASPIVNQQQHHHQHHHHHHHSSGGHHQNNSINSSHHSSVTSGIGRQSPRILHQAATAAAAQSSNLITDHCNSIADRGINSSSLSSGGSVIQPNSSPSLSATTTETGTLKITYEKQNLRVSKLLEEESIPARRSRTPDSGNFSTSTTSSNSINLSTTSTNSLNNGGLKFTYEQQIGATCNNLSPSTIIADTNLLSSTQLKDSPPSSPGSEAGSTARKRGRKSNTTTTMTTSVDNKQDIKIFQNGGNIISGSGSGGGNNLATHMLGNQINPNSSMAQKMSDLVHMEIQDHSIYTQSQDTGSQMCGVPFPGKLNNTRQTNQPIGGSGTNSLTSMLSGTASANPSGNTPQSLEQLLERQWEQGSQFLMEQAQHFDIASLLSCLHQLRTENVRLEEHVNSLVARRDHLLAVNARLAIPLNTNVAQNQANLHMNGPTVADGVVGPSNSNNPVSSSRLSRNLLFNVQQQPQQSSTPQSQQQQQPIENGIDFRHTSSTNSNAIRHSSVHSSNYTSSSSSNAHGSSHHHGSNILSSSSSASNAGTGQNLQSGGSNTSSINHHHRRDHHQIMQSNLSSLNSQSSLPEQLLIRSGRATTTAALSSAAAASSSANIGNDLMINNNRRGDGGSSYHHHNTTQQQSAYNALHQSQLRRVDDSQGKPS